MESMNELEGSYALGVICKECPDQFVAARKDSPLIVGLAKVKTLLRQIFLQYLNIPGIFIFGR